MIRLGFVGAGRIAKRHFANLANMPDVSIAGICDPDPEARRSASDRTGAKAYEDLSKMLSEQDLDGAYVCIPAGAHGSVEERLAEEGVHLFVEKPISLDMGTAERVARAVDRAGVISSVGFHWRYSEGAQIARRDLDGGRIAMVLGFWMTGLPQQPWWRRRSENPAQIFEQTIHLFDLSRYLVGEVSELQSLFAMRCMEGVSELEDVSSVTLRFENGAIGSMASTYLTPYRHRPPLLHEWAARGNPLFRKLAIGTERLGLWRRSFDTFSFRIELMIVSEKMVHQIGQGSLVRTTGKARETFRAKVDPYLLESQAFVSAIGSGDGSVIRSPYHDALLTHHLILAAIESADAGQPVRFEREEPGEDPSGDA